MTTAQHRHSQQCSHHRHRSDADDDERKDFRLDVGFQRFTLHRFLSRDGRAYCNKLKAICKHAASVKEYKCYNCYLKTLDVAVEEGRQDG